jgi:hypothetical protein
MPRNCVCNFQGKNYNLLDTFQDILYLAVSSMTNLWRCFTLELY